MHLKGAQYKYRLTCGHWAAPPEYLGSECVKMFTCPRPDLNFILQTIQVRNLSNFGRDISYSSLKGVSNIAWWSCGCGLTTVFTEWESGHKSPSHSSQTETGTWLHKSMPVCENRIVYLFWWVSASHQHAMLGMPSFVYFFSLLITCNFDII